MPLKHLRLFAPHPTNDLAGRPPIPEGLSLSEATEARTQRVLNLCLADSTLTTYNASLNAFFKFCDREGVPPALRLPAHEHLLCAFAASLAGSHRYSTVRNYISAVRAWHIIHDVPWLAGLRLQYVMNGVDHLAPAARPPRAPVCTELTDCLHRDLDKQVPKNACVLLASSFGCWLQARLGELLPPKENEFDPKTTVKRSDLRDRPPGKRYRILHLPWTKTTGYDGADLYTVRQVGFSDPEANIENHLRVNNPPPHIPLFSYWTGNGWRILTKRAFLLTVNEVWSKHGIPHTTGHSFRIGGTTELLLRGVPPDVVKVMGRWSTDSFLRYWRRLEVVIPMYAEALRPIVSTIVVIDQEPRKRNPKEKSVTFA